MPQPPLSAPLITTIEVTNLCNLNCRYCYSRAGSTHMPVEAVVRLVSELSTKGVWEIVIAGGEPFLHPGIFEILSRIGQLGISVGITSNGTLLRGATLKDFARLCREYPGRFDLQISIDGPTPEENDVLRGSGHLVFQAVSEMVSAGLSLSIAAVLTKYNVEHACSIIDTFYPRVRRFHFIELMPSCAVDMDSENLYASRRQLRRTYAALREYEEDLPELTVTFPRLDLDSQTGERPTLDCAGCIGATTRMDINATGEVLACNIADTSVIGSIWDADLDAIWSSAAADRCRKETLPLCWKASLERRDRSGDESRQ